MATFGRTSEDTNDTTYGSTYIWGHKFTISEEGDTSSISAYIYRWAAVNVQMAIYTDDAPPAKVASSATVQNTTGYSWVTADITANLPAGDYWLCICSASDVYGKYATSDEVFYRQTGTYGTWPDTLASWTAYANGIMDIYCTYDPAGGGEESNVLYMLFES